MIPREQNVTLALLFAGVLIGALDIAIVGPALPAIRAAFAIDERALPWVLTIYVLLYLVGTPLLAKRADRRGPRLVFIESLAVFGVGSAIVAAAPSFAWLLLGRAVQAFGAGGLFPVAASVVAEIVPLERRGRVLGLIGAVFGVAFLIGPVLGGVLLPFSWRWLFIVNVPVTAALIVLARARLPSRAANVPRPLDAGGAVLLTVVLASGALGISQLDTAQGAGALLSPRVWPWLTLTVLALPMLFVVERRAVDPVLPPELFGSPQLRLVGAIALAAGAVEAGMVFLPELAVRGLAVDPSAASFMMLPLVITLAIGAPIAGRLLDAVGPRPVLQTGLSLTIAGLAAFALLPLDWVSFYGAGAVVGFGLSSLLGAPLRYVALQEAGEERRSVGQGLLTLCLSIGQLGGSALIGGVVGSAADALGGYRQALLAVAMACVAALVLSSALRGRVD